MARAKRRGDRHQELRKLLVERLLSSRRFDAEVEIRQRSTEREDDEHDHDGWHPHKAEEEREHGARSEHEIEDLSRSELDARKLEERAELSPEPEAPQSPVGSVVDRCGRGLHVLEPLGLPFYDGKVCLDPLPDTPRISGRETEQDREEKQQRSEEHTSELQ